MRPVLIDNCLKCHCFNKASAGLRFDSVDGLRTDDGRGSVIVPGNANASRIIHAIRRDGTDVAHMPPDHELSEGDILAIESWINSGARWPQPASTTRAAAESHWAFQPMRRVPLPQNPGPSSTVPPNQNPRWSKDPIDRWLLYAMQSRGLNPSEPASSRHLARRLTYDLTGLPPTQEQIEQLAGYESEPEKVEQLVDELLESVAFAEHWARHWLDIARYADTFGELEDSDDFNPHAYLYRDWVIQAFQNDLPFDDFIRLQLNADQIVDANAPDLAALGFLTVGNKFENNEQEIIDDRLDTIFRGLQGLTISCARCHDHKYDPITTEDYYSLYGIFAEASETTVPIFQQDEDRDVFARYESELRQLQFAFDRFVDQQRQLRYGKPYQQVASYLLAAADTESAKKISVDKDGQRSDGLHTTIINRYRDVMESAKSEHSSIFAPWIAYTQTPSLSRDEIDRLAREYSQWTANRESDTEVEDERDYEKQIHPSIAEFFVASPPKTKEELAKRYGDLFRLIADQWRTEVERAWATGTVAPIQLADEYHDEIRRLMFDEDPSLDVNNDTIKDSLDEATREKFDELFDAIREFKSSDTAPPQARVIADGGEREQYVFVRGNPDRQGGKVEPRFLSVLNPEPELFSWESARGELAQAITDPHNPLTARVWVNRVWGHLFGQGIVDTPSDFGVRGSSPTHPELLDRLALDFIKHEWSTRDLIRRIVLSAAYQQSSHDRADMQAIDPANRYLWRMNRKRLSSESLRDSLLATTGQLDQSVGGRAIKEDDTENRRRTIYAEVNRRHPSSLAKTFDFANAMMHSPQRYETIVPQQTLWLLNGPLATTLLQSDLEDLTEDDNSAELVTEAIYRRVLQREPTDEEIQLAIPFLEQAASQSSTPVLDEYSAWRYGIATLRRQPLRIEEFTEFDSNDDESWSLDGYRLDAAGGELGDGPIDRVVVRRWIVPTDGDLKLDSMIIHSQEDDKSSHVDGIAALVLRSGASVVGKCTVKNSEQELNADLRSVKRGETIDFIVHPRTNHEEDRFEWKIELVLKPDDSSTAWVTNSEQHYRSESIPLSTALSGPAQLMQVLWMSNEFLYID